MQNILRIFKTIFLSLFLSSATLLAQSLPQASPESLGLSSSTLSEIDKVVLDSIKQGETPGAVIIVGRNGKIAYRKAFGNRSIERRRLKMTADTVFDVASLTKPLATATSIMLLVERGELSLKDEVGKFLPNLEDERAKKITVEQLLTHTSGYRPDFNLGKKWDGHEAMLAELRIEKLINEPGAKFVYSDIGYIVLGEIVEKVSGRRLDAFVRSNQFKGLNRTRFLRRSFMRSISSLPWVEKIAPTERFCNQQSYLGGTPPRNCNTSLILRGTVHDPTAYRMDGVAGHAGLFSTADELAVLADAFLRPTKSANRILSPAIIEKMTRPVNVGPQQYRGLGWDIDTRFSSNRGELFPVGGFGHTGFTGPSMWMDPRSGVFVVYMANRVHPDGKGSVVKTRGQIATIAAKSITSKTEDLGVSTRSVAVLNGIDVLKKSNFEVLKGKRVGLVTNHTGQDLDGNSTIDVLDKAKRVKLKALFSPEHGIRGKLDQAKIDDSKDEKTGLPIYSLYGETRRPTAKQLENLDVLVFDIQDIGTRFYTYISTLRYLLEEAAKHRKKVLVLDRPNPINGEKVEGVLADSNKLSFVAAHTIPVRHGMTVGEIATMINRERGINAELEVIKMEGWDRGLWFDQTQQYWVNPSPNMRNLTQALLYPGIGMLEFTNVSVGRGTDTPFEVLGAPWMDGRRLAKELSKLRLPGISFVPIRFTPNASKFKGELCEGINFIVTDRDKFEPVRTGYEIAFALKRLFPEKWDKSKYEVLTRSKFVTEQLESDANAAYLISKSRVDERVFLERRKEFLLY